MHKDCMFRSKEFGATYKNTLVFATFSLAGWVFDFLLFSALVQFASFAPFLANFISAVIAATLVFVTYGWRMFQHRSIRSVLTYIGYQFIAIIVFSYMIDTLAALDLLGVFNAEFAKIVVTPVNFLTNYAVTRLLLQLLSRPPTPR